MSRPGARLRRSLDRLRGEPEAAPAPPRPARKPTGPLVPHQRMLPSGKGCVAVVLADAASLDSVPEWLGGLRGRRTHVVVPSAADAEVLAGPLADRPRTDVEVRAEGDLVARLEELGRIDVLLDLRGPTEARSRRDRWAEVFLLLRTEGAYVVGARDDLRSTERDWLGDLAGRMAPEQPVPASDLVAECHFAVGALTTSGHVLVLRKRLRHLLTLRDHEVPSLLRSRNPGVEVRDLEVLPAQVFTSRARVTSHESAVPILDLDHEIDVPELHLRHYTGQLVFGGQTLAYAPGTALPESFRFAWAATPTNPLLHSASSRMGRLTTRGRPGSDAETLEGPHYVLDANFRGHFGHVMSETVSRLWGWDAAKADLPDLKALLRVKPGSSADLERTLLTAYGVDERDIVTIEEPVRVESLVCAGAMWHNWWPFFVHPGIGDVWRRMAASIAAEGVTTYDKILVSRTAQWSRRTCRNQQAVEDLFAAEGYTVVYPENHSIPEQAALFGGARVVAGFGGSAMFNLMYADNLETVIVIGPEGYTARNEHLYTSVLGADVHYFWSTGDHSHPHPGDLPAPGSWSHEAYDSAFDFDFERNGDALRGLLRELG